MSVFGSVFGNRVKALREEKGLTQQIVAFLKYRTKHRFWWVTSIKNLLLTL